MTELAELLVRTAWSMKENTCIKIQRHIFNSAFGSGGFLGEFIDPRSPEDRFLEKLPGVNYGAFKITTDDRNGDVTLCRHPCGERRIREDSDRREA